MGNNNEYRRGHRSALPIKRRGEIQRLRKSVLISERTVRIYFQTFKRENVAVFFFMRASLKSLVLRRNVKRNLRNVRLLLFILRSGTSPPCRQTRTGYVRERAENGRSQSDVPLLGHCDGEAGSQTSVLQSNFKRNGPTRLLVHAKQLRQRIQKFEHRKLNRRGAAVQAFR